MLRRRRAMVAAMGVGGGGAAPPHYAPLQTLTISITKDVDIDSANPTTNRGAVNAIAVGELNSTVRTFRSLLYADLSGINVGSLIDTAKLRIFALTDFSSNARTMRAYRSKRAWLEGTGTPGITGDGATWNTYDGSTPWQTAGGFGADDCEQTDIGSLALTATETLNQFKEITLDPDSVEQMIPGGSFTNNGFLTKMDTEDGDAYNYCSGEHAQSAQRPELALTYYPLLSDNGRVLITFDDGVETQYTEGFAYMQTKGVKGTVFMETDNADLAGRLTWTQLIEMDAAGWDIANHTEDGTNLTTLTQAQAEGQLSGAEADLNSHGLTRASKLVAYPQGARNATTDAAMTATGMLFGRLAAGTDFDYSNPPDLYQIPAVLGDDVAPATLKQQIDDAMISGYALVLYYHGLTTAQRIADFKAVIDHIVDQNYDAIAISELYALMT